MDQSDDVELVAIPYVDHGWGSVGVLFGTVTHEEEIELLGRADEACVRGVAPGSDKDACDAHAEHREAVQYFEEFLIPIFERWGALGEFTLEEDSSTPLFDNGYEFGHPRRVPVPVGRKQVVNEYVKESTTDQT